MSVSNPYQTYQENSVYTAKPAELTLMLYNGCLKFIALAKNAIEKRNIEEKHTNITKTQKIITELIITLNYDYEISKEMKQLYEYMNRRLVEGNIKNDSSILNEVEDLVREFRDTWKEAMQIAKRK
ncbi:flagellar export chaperone FliS [Neobacillus terrae]|uniref:flagellar export chaperone FliS n=1 Tax=Neobacillus terrae TaxID=3034837 RepID=UPI00140C420A|nr:flagellar export chaperone FliS [Neobacillus terrae]NHM29956.1 flagellar export chaperone FliS [Neobacillus terrae]